MTFRLSCENIDDQGQISSMVITPPLIIHNVHLHGKGDYLILHKNINISQMSIMANRVYLGLWLPRHGCYGYLDINPCDKHVIINHVAVYHSENDT